jgi:hypothetical protein
MNQLFEEEQPIPASESSQVATAVMPLHSSLGTVLGTVGCMSSEQAKVKPNEINQRLDISPR